MMKISDLIKQLEKMKEENGDLPVRVQTLSHTWAPEPEIRKNGSTFKFVLLNP